MAKTIFSPTEDPLKSIDLPQGISYTQLMSHLKLMLELRKYLWDNLSPDLRTYVGQDLGIKHTLSIESLISPKLAFNTQGQISQINLYYYFGSLTTMLEPRLKHLLKQLGQERAFLRLQDTPIVTYVRSDLYAQAQNSDSELTRQDNSHINNYYYAQALNRRLNNEQYRQMLGLDSQAFAQLVGVEGSLETALQKRERDLQANVLDLENPELAAQIDAYLEEQVEDKLLYQEAQEFVSQKPGTQISREQLKTQLFWQMLEEAIKEGDNSALAARVRAKYEQRKYQPEYKPIISDQQPVDIVAQREQNQRLRQLREQEIKLNNSLQEIKGQVRKQLTRRVQEIFLVALAEFKLDYWKNFYQQYYSRYLAAQENSQTPLAQEILALFKRPLDLQILGNFSLAKYQAQLTIGATSIAYEQDLGEFVQQSLTNATTLFNLYQTLCPDDQFPYWEYVLDKVLVCCNWSEFFSHYWETKLFPAFMPELVLDGNCDSIAEYNQRYKLYEQGELELASPLTPEQQAQEFARWQNIIAHNQQQEFTRQGIAQALQKPEWQKYKEQLEHFASNTPEQAKEAKPTPENAPSAADWDELLAKLVANNAQAQENELANKAKSQLEAKAKEQSKPELEDKPEQQRQANKELDLDYWRHLQLSERVQLQSNKDLPFYAQGAQSEQAYATISELIKEQEKELLRCHYVDYSDPSLPKELVKQLVREKNAYLLALARGYNPAYSLVRMQNKFLERLVRLKRRISNYFVFLKDLAKDLPVSLLMHDEQAPYIGKMGMTLALQKEHNQLQSQETTAPAEQVIKATVEQRYAKRQRLFVQEQVEKYLKYLQRQARLQQRQELITSFYDQAQAQLAPSQAKEAQGLRKQIQKETKKYLKLLEPVFAQLYQEYKLAPAWQEFTFDLLQVRAELIQHQVPLTRIFEVSARLNQHDHPLIVQLFTLIEQYEALLGLTNEQEYYVAPQSEVAASSEPSDDNFLAWVQERQAKAQQQYQQFSKLVQGLAIQQLKVEQKQLQQQIQQVKGKAPKEQAKLIVPQVQGEAKAHLSLAGENLLQKATWKKPPAPSEALRQMARLQRQLAQEPELELSPELIQMYEQLLLHPEQIEGHEEWVTEYLPSTGVEGQVGLAYYLSPSELEEFSLEESEPEQSLAEQQDLPLLKQRANFSSLYEYKRQKASQTAPDRNFPKVSAYDLEPEQVTNLASATSFAHLQQQVQEKISQTWQAKPALSAEQLAEQKASIHAKHAQRRQRSELFVQQMEQEDLEAQAQKLQGKRKRNDPED
ncbi:hypothetical protein CJP74_01930 [Psittacicella melopsittaci]|uniref:Uncharacterized protein n=1 Tax=Psittacicella melopsittaci TaxID=2028576 RepID=A0A3A1Y815_9GAMM|nr:hypothetical protein [Psittacicella melopsittaci]RIY33369.1 hypothetical protein CJP74_01930 [Psittacicella melopsittaci]